LNFELILDLKPDVVFAYGINASVNKMVARLREFGIPVVLVAEYLEEDPLAKMEWIKFFGCFFNTLDDAAAIFDSAANEYNR
jgi:iron complex transport system substrate-binding protein